METMTFVTLLVLERLKTNKRHRVHWCWMSAKFIFEKYFCLRTGLNVASLWHKSLCKLFWSIILVFSLTKFSMTMFAPRYRSCSGVRFKSQSWRNAFAYFVVIFFNFARFSWWSFSVYCTLDRVVFVSYIIKTIAHTCHYPILEVVSL